MYRRGYKFGLLSRPPIICSYLDYLSVWPGDKILLIILPFSCFQYLYFPKQPWRIGSWGWNTAFYPRLSWRYISLIKKSICAPWLYPHALPACRNHLLIILPCAYSFLVYFPVLASSLIFFILAFTFHQYFSCLLVPYIFCRSYFSFSLIYLLPFLFHTFSYFPSLHSFTVLKFVHYFPSNLKAHSSVLSN